MENRKSLPEYFMPEFRLILLKFGIHYQPPIEARLLFIIYAAVLHLFTIINDRNSKKWVFLECSYLKHTGLW